MTKIIINKIHSESEDTKIIKLGWADVCVIRQCWKHTHTPLTASDFMGVHWILGTPERNGAFLHLVDSFAGGGAWNGAHPSHLFQASCSWTWRRAGTLTKLDQAESLRRDEYRHVNLKKDEAASAVWAPLSPGPSCPATSCLVLTEQHSSDF